MENTETYLLIQNNDTNLSYDVKSKYNINHSTDNESLISNERQIKYSNIIKQEESKANDHIAEDDYLLKIIAVLTILVYSLIIYSIKIKG